MDIEKIMAYESDEMSEEDVVKFFQELIDSGDCWKLQGHYGRRANNLISLGFCKMKPVNIEK